MAIWKKVLTEADITTAITDNSLLVPTSDAVFDAIATASAASGSGDITKIEPYPNGGVVVWQDVDNNGIFAIGDATSGDAQLQVKAGLGITVDSNGVNIASAAAGDGLSISSGVLKVNPGLGVKTVNDTVAANVDDATIETDTTVGSTLGQLQIKDGGVSFDKFAGSAIVTSSEALVSFSQSDTQLITTSALGVTFPNVTLAAGHPTYVSSGGTASQQLTFTEISISDHTDLSVATAGSAQDSLQLSLDTSSVLSATAPNLGVDDNVQFANITGTGDLTVNGSVQLGNAISDNVIIAGNLTVQGQTTTLEVATLKVEDKIITIATSSSPSPASANNSGIQIETGTSETEFPELKWKGNTPLTGWQVQNYVNGRTTDDDLVSIAVMDVKTNALPTQTSLSAGVGSFWFDETTDRLLIRVS